MMELQIRPLSRDDITAVIDLSLLAWAPVFRSFEQVLDGILHARGAQPAHGATGYD